MVQERPVPVEIISQDVKVTAYVPLEDLARALGSDLEHDPNLDRYSILSTGDGILVSMPPPDDGRPGGEAKPTPVPRPAPVVDPSARLVRPPAAVLARGQGKDPSERGASFWVGDRLVSKGIVVIGGGKPFIPLDDLAAVMNSTLEQSAEGHGRWSLGRVPGRASSAFPSAGSSSSMVASPSGDRISKSAALGPPGCS